MLFPKTVI